MKKNSLICFFILVYSVSYSQNRSEQSKWGEWTSTSEFKYIEFRAKYNEDTRSGKRRSQLEFRNTSEKGLSFYWFVKDKRTPNINDRDDWYVKNLDAKKSGTGLTYEVYNDDDYITVYIGGVFLSEDNLSKSVLDPYKKNEQYRYANQEIVDDLKITESDITELCIYCSLFKNQVGYLKKMCKDGKTQKIEEVSNHAEVYFGEVISESEIKANATQKAEMEKFAQSPAGTAVVVGASLFVLGKSIAGIVKNNREAKKLNDIGNETKKPIVVSTASEKRKKRLKIYYVSMASLLAISIAINHDKIF